MNESKRDQSLRVLVACEFSGTVRDAFRALGHEAMSCDLLPSETPGPHYQGDVRDLLTPGRWDLMIAHPPCTHLAVSGARWWHDGWIGKGDNRRWYSGADKRREQSMALDFVRLLLAAPVPHIALENPVSIISSRIRKPDQIIQPFEYGEPFRKTTCLWLKDLPLLTSTQILSERKQQCWLEPPGPDRWKRRSRTYAGIARAMARQWGDFVVSRLASTQDAPQGQTHTQTRVGTPNATLGTARPFAAMKQEAI